MRKFAKSRQWLTALFLIMLSGVLIPATPAMASQAARHRAADALALQAYDLMDRGHLEGAITKFRAAHKLNPKDQIIRHHLAELLTATGVSRYQNHRYAAAASRLQEALSVEPGFERAHTYLDKVQFIQFFARGKALYAAGKVTAARRQFVRAVAAAPENKAARIALFTAEADLLTAEATESALTDAITRRQDAADLAPKDTGLQQKLADSRTALALCQVLGSRPQD